MDKRTAIFRVLAPISLVIVIFCFNTWADDGEVVYPRAYDGFQASADAQAYWETRRRDAINRQLGWKEWFQWRAAASQPNTLYYDPYLPVPWTMGDTIDDPWPYASGRIFGYGFYDRVPQPIGRRQVQTGPNRWESLPVYAGELDAAPSPIVAPPSPLAKPPVTPPPQPEFPLPAPRGREF